MNWYYAKDGQQIGPVTQQEIEAKFRSGEISSEALVWQEGMPDWKPAGQVMSQAVAPDEASQGIDSLYSAPTASHAPVIGSGNIDAVIKRASFAKFMVLFVVGYLLLLVGSGLLTYGDETGNVSLTSAGGVTLLVGVIGIIWGTVLGLVYLHRCWVIVNCGLSGLARTTPGKAVGFLFIPFYNFYWVFQAYSGLAQDYNIASAKNGWGHQMPEGLFTAYSILTILGFIPVINYISGMGSLVVGPMTVYNMCKMINHHANA